MPLIAIALTIYCLPVFFLGLAGIVAVAYNLEHRYDGTSRLIFEALGLALFWPGAIAFWRYKAKGYRMDWWWFPVAVFFYLGFIAAELSHEEDLWVP